MESDALIIGKRYWLDSIKDISAVYVGIGDMGGREFNEIEVAKKVKNPYIISDGKVTFGSDKGFYLV